MMVIAAPTGARNARLAGFVYDGDMVNAAVPSASVTMPSASVKPDTGVPSASISLTEKAKDYVILDNVHGSGKYVGTYLALTTLERYWYGEGEVKIYLDGDEEYPTICGTGTEDYFGGAWSFAHQEDGRTVEQTFCTPFLGYPYYSNRDTNERQTDFIDCVAWRSTAEFVSKYFQKGSLSVVSGRLQLRDWTDKDGNKRRNAEVVVDNIYFGESRRRDAESSSQFSTPYSNDYPSQSASSLAPSEFEELSEDDGELPF